MSSDIELRPVTDSDLSAVYWLTSDPAATGDHEWHGWLDPWWYRRRWEENGLLGEDGGMLVITRPDEVLGVVSWRKRETGRSSFCWNVGIALIPHARGLGYGAHAQELLVRYLFAHTQVNRIEAEADAANQAEQRALEQAGFTREGVSRGAVFQGGQWRDTVMWSVLRSDVTL